MDSRIQFAVHRLYSPRRRLFRAAAALLISWVATMSAAAQIESVTADSAKPRAEIKGGAWVYSTTGEYHNVRDDLVDAIESYGMVVSYTAHTAAMLERTAEAVGAIKKVYAFADTLLFCKADLTYKLTLANPHNLVLCPYAIAVYSLRDDKDTIYISFRKPDLHVPEYAAVHQLLEDIVLEVIE
jgi:hypothetical protein